MGALWAVNPSKRRKKHRSAAQRAATRKMLAARFHRNPRRKRKAATTEVQVKRKYTKRRGRKSARIGVRRGRRSGGFAAKFSSGAITALLKNGAIAGGGAVLVDIGMGYASGMLPASMATPTDSNGALQWGYVGAKAGLALLLGTLGKRIMPAEIAGTMAEGALTVLSYQLIRPMVPASLKLGYINPAPVANRTQAVGAYVRGAGAYAALPVRASVPARRGANAAQVVRMVNSRR